MILCTIPHGGKSFAKWMDDKRSLVNSKTKTMAQKRNIPVVDLEYWSELTPYGKTKQEIDKVPIIL